MSFRRTRGGVSVVLYYLTGTYGVDGAVRRIVIITTRHHLSRRGDIVYRHGLKPSGSLTRGRGLYPKTYLILGVLSLHRLYH